MGRMSLKKRTGLKNLKSKRVVNESSAVEQNVNLPVKENNVTEAVTTQSAISELKDKRSDKEEAFSRGLLYSERYQRKLNQRNREMAEGSAKITSYFSATKPAAEEPILV